VFRGGWGWFRQKLIMSEHEEPLRGYTNVKTILAFICCLSPMAENSVKQESLYAMFVQSTLCALPDEQKIR
jgi:hypothetical protein